MEARSVHGRTGWPRICEPSRVARLLFDACAKEGSAPGRRARALLGDARDPARAARPARDDASVRPGGRRAGAGARADGGALHPRTSSRSSRARSRRSERRRHSRRERTTKPGAGSFTDGSATRSTSDWSSTPRRRASPDEERGRHASGRSRQEALCEKLGRLVGVEHVARIEPREATRIGADELRGHGPKTPEPCRSRPSRRRAEWRRARRRDGVWGASTVRRRSQGTSTVTYTSLLPAFVCPGNVPAV